MHTPCKEQHGSSAVVQASTACVRCCSRSGVVEQPLKAGLPSAQQCWLCPFAIQAGQHWHVLWCHPLQSKPISGGIPHCFPQFGPGEMQQHGFGRNLDWMVRSTAGITKVWYCCC